MKRFWDPGISQTILFVFGVFTFVIASYGTLVKGGIEGLYDNYLLFMISFACILGLRYLRQRDKEAAAEAAAARQAELKKASKPTKKGKKRK
ncbi:hypothetical protein CDA63_08830 [Hymenobacter amundsenii]|uniref:Uncharacterized protein n=1 Tax=Hymenobacter amundsenii TaxID=2006685 RepID=A0A246FL74_9BACT|nr:hypothetical protein [Hymenobacter amundsenii]OWP63472.1 hypothetical protein CDA63_08830 [Hymenobacter amundsenii]